MFEEEYTKLLRYVQMHTEVVSELREVCESEDTTDRNVLCSYYKLRTIELAGPLLSKFDGLMKTCGEGDAFEQTTLTYRQLLDAIQDFGNAISEFQNNDSDSSEDEGYGRRSADSEDEDVLFDKIKNLSSSFKYYSEEIERLVQYA